MADVSGKFFSAKKVRTGVSPSSPGVEQGETLPPVNPPGTSLNSVGLTMPSAFEVANSPLTSNGTIAVTGAGTVSQYVRGDGSLADFPESIGSGASVSYYLNGSVNQGTIGGVTYYEMNKTPIIGAGTDFSRNSNGYIASFLTDANDPSLLVIPAGNWNFETYFQASSGGGSPTFYLELYKYDGTTFSLIASNSGSPKLINDGTQIEAYFSALAVPQTTLTLTDRLAIRIYVTTAGRTLTLHTENGHLCQVITTFTTGLSALNGLTAQVQFFAVGTSGTNFNIASASDTHTFNLPTASATNRGALSSTDWSTFNNKQNQLNGTGFVKANGTTISYDNSTYQVTSEKGQPNGYASLDGNGKVPLAQINDALIGNVNYQGLWNASTNNPTLVNPPSSGTKGYYYIVSTAGTFASISFEVGDWIISNGSAWQKVDNTDAVSSVFGRTGNVIAANGDYNTSQVTENTNLYFTQARVSANTDVAANTAARHNAVTLGTANGLSLSTQQLSLQLASGSQNGALSSTDWTTFNSKENAITAGTTAQYFRGDKTFQTLNTAAVPESGNLYFTQARVSANTDVAANTAARHNAVTLGTANGLSLSTQQLSLGLASAGVTGALSGTDWSTFNSKQNALNGTGFVKISGTTISYDNSTYLTTSAAASTYLALAGGTMTGNVNWGQTDRGITWAFNTDAAYIKFFNTGDGDTDSRLEFATQDNNDEYFRWGHVPSGGSFYESMRLRPIGSGSAELIVTGKIIKSGGTSSQFLKADGSVDSNSYYLSSNPSAFIALTALSGTAPIQYNNTTGAISITQASGSTNGFLSSTDWTTFNNKQAALNGTGFVKISGTTISYDNSTYLTTAAAASTYVPYTGATSGVDLGTYTLSASNLIANGGFNAGALLLKQSSNAQTIFLGYTAITPVGNNTLNFGFSTGSGVWKNFTLSSFLLTDNINRTYTLPDASGTIALVGGSGVGTVTSVAALTLGTSGTDLSSTVANSTTTPVITLNVPTASAANRGALSAADWTTFNNKQNALTNPVTGTGTAGQVAYWSSGSAITGEANLFWDSTNDRLGIGTATPLSFLDISSGTTTDIIRFGPSSRWGFRRENNDNRYVAFYRGLSSTPSAVWTVDGDNGNVGVNTSSPGERFTVNGYVGLQRSGTQIWHYGVDASNSIEFVRSGIATRMTLSSDGNLGLGVTPSAWGNPFKVIEGGGSGFQQFIGFQNNDNSLKLGVNHYYNGSAYVYTNNGLASRLDINADKFIFNTAPSGTAGNAISFTQAMTLTSGGNLLVGGTTDHAKLTVINDNNNANAGQFIVSGATNTLKILSLGYNTTSNYGFISVYTAGVDYNPLALQPNGGNVLIGTTSNDGSRLRVNGVITMLPISSAPTWDTSTRIWMEDFFGSRYDGFQHRFDVGSSRTQALLINSTGAATFSSSVTANGNNLTIQPTTTTTYALSVMQNAGGFLRVGRDTSTGALYGSDYAALLVSSGNYAMIIGTNDTERMRITSGGNVGIGTIPSAFTGYTNLELANSSGSVLTLRNNANTAQFAIETDINGTLFRNTSNTGMAFLTNNNIRMVISSAGNIAINESLTTDILRVGGNTFTNTITTLAPTGNSNPTWRLGASRGGTVTTNATVRVQIDGVLVDLVARYV
jgi:hypothetical protein